MNTSRCRYKRQYNSYEEAITKGFNVYKCPECGFYHRTTIKSYIKKRAGKYKNGWYSILNNEASIWSSFSNYLNKEPPNIKVHVASIKQVEKIMDTL